MHFLNTDMHMVTFTITMFELVMLVFQIIYFLQRPSDKSRLQYLILLLCLIAHNICSGLFPDEQFLISITVQNIVAYLVGFIMSMYVIYYFYKVFELRDLKFFATYGLLFFLFLPFVFLFLVPYLLTGNVRLSAQLTVVIPFLYALGFIYYTARALILKFRNSKKEGTAINDPLYEHAIVAYISLVCWASLPVIVFFGDFQVLEHSVTNAGFLMMTIIYVRSSIKQSRKEYNKLLESEKNLQQLNRDLKKKVRQRTKRLEQLIEERKTTFINLAHETKTPLTLINNYLSDYIQKHGNSEEIHVIKKNISRLTKDIVNFFDVESYEKGFSLYNHNQVSNFTAILSSKVVLFQSLAKRKGITIEYALPPSLHLKAHPGAIDRIVNNLIENAIKYSRENGTVRITLDHIENQIIFSVKDNGVGIPQELQERVFEPYFKLSLSGEYSGGMGMGLSIVKKIVDDLSGNISLKSELNAGTEIQIFLPLFDSTEDEVHNAVVPQDNWDFDHHVEIGDSIVDAEKPYILLVEDNEDMLGYLLKKLKGKYNLLVARNGWEALNRMETLNSLDLILSDIMMKDMDGYEFCSRIIEDERYTHIPFVFLTAKAMPVDKAKGLGMGAIGYVEKPFSIDQLIFKIESILSMLKKQRTAVVNQAYKAILPGRNQIHNSSLDFSKGAFLNNCKKYNLTAREIEIIRQLMKGQPYKLIGDQLHISDKTVAKHISNIFTKVSVNNKVELINKLEVRDLIKLE